MYAVNLEVLCLFAEMRKGEEEEEKKNISELQSALDVRRAYS